jgi:hypothetical protein
VHFALKLFYQDSALAAPPRLSPMISLIVSTMFTICHFRPQSQTTNWKCHHSDPIPPKLLSLGLLSALKHQTLLCALVSKHRFLTHFQSVVRTPSYWVILARLNFLTWPKMRASIDQCTMRCHLPSNLTHLWFRLHTRVSVRPLCCTLAWLLMVCRALHLQSSVVLSLYTG